MTDDEAFQRTIQAAPHDDSSRLVYADWLEERNDERSRYLRLENKLVHAWFYDNPCAEIFEELESLQRRIDPDWLRRVRRLTTPPPPVMLSKGNPTVDSIARTTV